MRSKTTTSMKLHSADVSLDSEEGSGGEWRGRKSVVH